jgi:transketolase
MGDMTEAQKLEHLQKLATLVRYNILTMTTQAGSGHPTSSLSATELMVGLMFGGIFRYDLDHPKHPNNDRLIFSKGHATPLFYSLWALAGKLTAAELMTYRHFGSPLEGHPTMSFRSGHRLFGAGPGHRFGHRLERQVPG